MHKAGKVWGQTETIFSNGSMELHRIEIKKGGVCSKHMHKFKWNGFYVEDGKLLIRVWKNNYDLVDETTLHAGEATQVTPLEYHQFEALEDTVAFEWYWAEFDPDDIEREDHGHSGGEHPAVSED